MALPNELVKPLMSDKSESLESTLPSEVTKNEENLENASENCTNFTQNDSFLLPAYIPQIKLKEQESAIGRSSTSKNKPCPGSFLESSKAENLSLENILSYRALPLFDLTSNMGESSFNYKETEKNNILVSQLHSNVDSVGVSGRTKTFADCLICCKSFESFEGFDLVCGHFYCLDCLKSFAETVLKDRNLIPIQCCQSKIPESIVAEIYSGEQLVKYKSFLSFPTSSSTVEDTENSELKELMKQKGWKNCPRCRTPVEKTFGCYHIKCFCKAKFCYKCGGNWPNSVQIFLQNVNENICECQNNPLFPDYPLEFEIYQQQFEQRSGEQLTQENRRRSQIEQRQRLLRQEERRQRIRRQSQLSRALRKKDMPLLSEEIKKQKSHVERLTELFEQQQSKMPSLEQQTSPSKIRCAIETWSKIFGTSSTRITVPTAI